MSEFDFLTPFYKEQYSRETLLSGLDSLLTHKKLFVRAIPVGSSNQHIGWLQNVGSQSRIPKLIYETSDVSLFRLSYMFREHGSEKTGHGHFFIMSHLEYKDVFVVFTVESSVFYHRVLLPFLRAQYPRLLMTFITHKRLRNLLESFQKQNRFSSLTITRASQRLRHERGRVVPVVSWPGMDLDEGFRWVYENNGWFQSLEFEAKRNRRVHATIGLTRQGEVKTNRILENVYEAFVLPVCKTIHENLDFFSKRSRRETPHLGVRPLAIEFETDQFDNLDENARLVEAMRQLRAASISVVHGNPYIHLSIIDYLDGSTFDVWALGGNQLIIVPQMRGTMLSIKRLVNHIFDNYSEGKIVNYSGVQL